MSSVSTKLTTPATTGANAWRLGTLLRATLGAMVAGAKSLAKVEDLSERMSQPTRRLLGIRRRLPDTTLRNALCTIEPAKLRRPLHA